MKEMKKIKKAAANMAANELDNVAGGAGFLSALTDKAKNFMDKANLTVSGLKDNAIKGISSLTSKAKGTADDFAGKM